MLMSVRHVLIVDAKVVDREIVLHCLWRGVHLALLFPVVFACLLKGNAPSIRAVREAAVNFVMRSRWRGTIR